MTQPEWSERFRQPQSVAEVLDRAAGPYAQYDLYKDARGAIEAIVPHLTPDTVAETDYNAVQEVYSFGNIGNIGVRLRRDIMGDSWNADEWDRFRYEVQFQPLLDENMEGGYPISYIGFLFDDELHTRSSFMNATTRHQPSIEYRRIGAPIIVPDEFSKTDSEHAAEAGDDSAAKAARQIVAFMFAQGAHGHELFRATKAGEAVKLCLSLADELREVRAVDGFSQRWQNRLAAIYESRDKLAVADELRTPRETDFGQLNLTVDESGITAAIVGAPDTPPFLGYRLSQDRAGGPRLDSVSLLGADLVNDMDAVVFEQLLRLHTADWIPFGRD